MGFDFSTFLLIFVITCPLIISILVRAKRDLIVVLICMSLVTNDVELLPCDY